MIDLVLQILGPYSTFAEIDMRIFVKEFSYEYTDNDVINSR